MAPAALRKAAAACLRPAVAFVAPQGARCAAQGPARGRRSRGVAAPAWAARGRAAAWGSLRRYYSSTEELLTQDVLRSVVKVFATASHPNYFLPWQRKFQHHSTGSGFVVDRRRHLLLTNAHVVLDATFIEVRREADSEKFSARIAYIGMDCDLAILTVDDPAFWEGLQQLPICSDAQTPADAAEGDLKDVVETVGVFDGLPRLQHSVKVVGYPVGGDQVSVTSGVVSRVDTVPYAVCNEAHLLAIQIDAAINPGNSGGPALSNNRVIGVSFQSLQNTDNISYIIPIPVVAHFLRQFYRAAKFTAQPGGAEVVAIQDPASSGVSAPSGVPLYGHPFYHPGFCSLGCYIQEPVNDSLREDLGLTKAQRGVIIQKVMQRAPVRDVLQEGDVLLAVDGVPLANDGTVIPDSRPNVRVKFLHLLQMHGYGEPIRVLVFRDGAEREMHINAGVVPSLVPAHLYNPYFKQTPKYLMTGGLIFTPLTMPYLMEWGEWFNNSPRYLVDQALWGERTEDVEELVILAQILPHEVNKGYQAEQFNNRIVRRINGEAVRSLGHLSSLLTGLRERGEARACFELALHGVLMRLVLDIPKALKADSEIVQLYNVPATEML
eukprot:TRINITY_DN14525_c0_g2_i1.p1 TRINITY_DN14525_c0_g2~~TRINITY_DN14525_c0_g2_i1.p1  ORF type:complete len:607 (+),score=146.80 TRINITY_DN14525_c0_g2_i1:86-1906(+)